MFCKIIPKTNLGKLFYEVHRTFYEAYGRGAHARALNDSKETNPYTYGTLEYDAWNNGWDRRK